MTSLNLESCNALITLINSVEPIRRNGAVTYGNSGSFTLCFDEDVQCFTAFPDLTLPASLSEIGSEAFAGSEFDSLYIPESVTTIAEDAFGDRTGLTIIGVPGSAAEIFAQNHGFDFVPVA